MIVFLLSLTGGFGGFAYGAAYPDVSPINSVFAQVLPGFEKTIYNTGGGGYGLIKGFLIGGSGFGGTISTESDSMHAELSYGGGFFEVGYLKPIFRASYGFITLGAGGMDLSLTLRKSLSDVPMDSLIKNPGRMSILSTGGMCLTVNAGLLVRISKFFLLGLKAGYVYSPVEPNWKLSDGHEVLGGPEVNLSSPYVSINFYFGSLVEE